MHHKASASPPSRLLGAAVRAGVFLGDLNGFGVVIWSWAFAAVLFGSVALLAAGLTYWNSWLFLAGLLCVRVYIGLCRKCDRLMNAPLSD